MIDINGQPVNIQSTGTTRNGHPVLLVDGALYELVEVPDE